jgi:hypothetical protein
MSLRGVARKKVFGGRRDPFKMAKKWGTTGAPTGAHKLGGLVYNTVDGDYYICTVATGTYVKINA